MQNLKSINIIKILKKKLRWSRQVLQSHKLFLRSENDKTTKQLTSYYLALAFDSIQVEQMLWWYSLQRGSLRQMIKLGATLFDFSIKSDTLEFQCSREMHNAREYLYFTRRCLNNQPAKIYIKFILLSKFKV